MRLERGDIVVAPPQLGFPEDRVNLAVADGMQQHRFPPAIAPGNEVMTFPPASQGTSAQGASKNVFLTRHPHAPFVATGR